MVCARKPAAEEHLAHAANFTNYWSAERIRTSFETAWREEGREPDEVLREAVGVGNAEVYWATVDERITARRLRLIFVADAIPSELRQIIEFLNEELRNTEVLGIEIREHAGDGGSLITSRANGSTEAAFGTGLHNPGMQIGIKRPDAYLFPFTLYSGGGVEINFQQMAGVPYPPFHRLGKRTDLRRRLIAELGVEVPEDRISLRPSFSHKVLLDAARFEKSVEIYEWALAEAVASGIGLANLDAARHQADV